MKTFSVFLTNGKILHVTAMRYRREGDQYVFEKDEAGEDVQFYKESKVEGILEGKFSAGCPRRRKM